MPLARSPAPPFWWWSKSPVSGSWRPPTSTRRSAAACRSRSRVRTISELAVDELEHGDREDVVGVEVARVRGDLHSASTVAERYLAASMLRAALAATLAALALAAPAAADWSGDGAADVLAVHPDGRLLLYRGTGAGRVRRRRRGDRDAAGRSFTALLTGDWSGDGEPGHPRPRPGRAAADVPRQRQRRLRHGPGRADRLGLGARSPRCCCRATGTATASATSSPATATGAC